MYLSLSLSFFSVFVFSVFVFFEGEGLCVSTTTETTAATSTSGSGGLIVYFGIISKDGLFSADHFSKLLWDLNVCQDVNICLSEVDLLGKICFSI